MYPPRRAVEPSPAAPRAPAALGGDLALVGTRFVPSHKALTKSERESLSYFAGRRGAGVDGGEHSIEAKNGHKVMEIIRDAGLDIEAACGGCCACATCHVYVDAEWFPKLTAADEEEADMLDLAMDVQDNSRLSCQLEMSDALDGLRVELAPA